MNVKLQRLEEDFSDQWLANFVAKWWIMAATNGIFRQPMANFL
jgi:hypothetical protein